MTTDTSRYYSYLADYDRIVAFNNRIRKMVRRKVNKTSVGKAYLKAKRKYKIGKFLREAFPIAIRGVVLLAMLFGFTCGQIGHWSNRTNFEKSDIFFAVTMVSALCYLSTMFIPMIITFLDSKNKIFLSDEATKRLDDSFILFGYMFYVALFVAGIGAFFFYKWWEVLIILLLSPFVILGFIIFRVLNVGAGAGWAGFLQALYPILAFVALIIVISWLDFLVFVWTEKLTSVLKERAKMKRLESALDKAYEKYTEAVNKVLEQKPLKDEASAWEKVRRASREVDWDAVSAQRQAQEAREKARKENEKLVESIKKHNEQMEKYARERERQGREALGQLEKANRQRDNISVELERWRNQ